MNEASNVWGEDGWVRCSCCGTDIEDTAEQNVDHETRHHDRGFGMCTRCGGDDRETGTSEAAVRKRLGWSGQMFYDARVKVLASKLSPANAAHFASMPYDKKIRIIAKLIERGAMI